MPTEGYNSGSLFEMKFYFSGSQWVDFRLGLGVVCSEPKRPSRAVFKVSTPGSKTVDVGRCSLGHLVLVAFENLQVKKMLKHLFHENLLKYVDYF